MLVGLQALRQIVIEPRILAVVRVEALARRTIPPLAVGHAALHVFRPIPRQVLLARLTAGLVQLLLSRLPGDSRAANGG